VVLLRKDSEYTQKFRIRSLKISISLDASGMTMYCIKKKGKLMDTGREDI
jgi:hypothetical protein